MSGRGETLVSVNTVQKYILIVGLFEKQINDVHKYHSIWVFSQKGLYNFKKSVFTRSLKAKVALYN